MDHHHENVLHLMGLAGMILAASFCCSLDDRAAAGPEMPGRAAVAGNTQAQHLHRRAPAWEVWLVQLPSK